MSDTTPTLKFGDRVRVMQTDEMEQCGYANRLGTVVGKQRTPSHGVWVALDETHEEPEEHIYVFPHSLMKTSKR